MKYIHKGIGFKTLMVLYATAWYSSLSYSYQVTHTVKRVDDSTQKVQINFSLQPDEYIYKDSLQISANNPALTVTPLEPSHPATTLFDKAFKTDKEVYADPLTFTSTIHYKASDQKSSSPEAELFVPFMVNTSKESQHLSIPVSFKPEGSTKGSASSSPSASAKPAASSVARSFQQVPAQASSEAAQVEASKSTDQGPSKGSLVQQVSSLMHSMTLSVKNFLSSLFSSTGSPFVRIGAAFLLGLLLSLTPCIYPMIPITVGILQASGSTSTFKNFLLALSYTLGISTIFALFGFFAAVGGPAFGELQGNPFFVIPVALLLFYFGLTMFDIVTLPIPKFLQPKPGKVQGGSLTSAYIFGAVSGTIASPCLSPGLILILHYVASIASGSVMGYLEGLILLFAFGIGSSMPLLIIGTFSGSLKLLPKSGMWMVEIKKLIGIMLISMALYHLSHLERLLPWHILAWVVVAVYSTLGVFYIIKSNSSEGTWMNIYRFIVGILLFIAAGLIAVQGYKALYDYRHPQKEAKWHHDYRQAFERAKQEGKLLFADIGATYCGACKHMHKSIFTKQPIIQALEQFVVVSIESDIHTDSYNAIKKEYGSFIEGFPTYLVINPATKEVIKDWSVEIEELGIDKFKVALETLAADHKAQSQPDTAVTQAA